MPPTRLWEDDAPGIEIYCFSEAAKKRIIEKITPQAYSKINASYVYVSAEKIIDSKTFLEKLWYFQKEAINE